MYVGEQQGTSPVCILSTLPRLSDMLEGLGPHAVVANMAVALVDWVADNAVGAGMLAQE